MAHLPVSIIFRGNDIDGWMAAYLITHMQTPSTPIKYYPVNPTKNESWPSPSVIQNTILYILSSTPQDATILDGYNPIALFHFDHHATARDILHGRPGTFFNESLCSTGQIFCYFYPNFPIPNWIGLVDRLARWQAPTLEDKALREILHPIACLAVRNRIDLAREHTRDFLVRYNDSENYPILVRQGMGLLAMKDGTLTAILRRGEIFTLTSDEIDSWNLPGSWEGRQVFLLNNTGIAIDSTLASSNVFDENPTVDIFVNYRVFETANPLTGLPGMEYVFNARARNGAGIDLTERGVFAGHSCSAGGHYFSGQERQVPFVV